MNLVAKMPKTGSILVATVLALSLGWVSNASAQQVKSTVYSLTGNARTQIGGGLPLPITLQPIPNGKVPVAGFVRQTNGPDPKAMIFAQSGLNFGPITSTIGVFLANSALFEVQTSLVINSPVKKATFKAGGRSGPQNFTWCPGQALPAGTFNPACTNPLTPTPTTPYGVIAIQASIKYMGTLTQFGGVSQPGVGGGARVAIRAGTAAAPCQGWNGTAIVNVQCRAILSQVVPNATGVVGGPLGNSAYDFVSAQPIHVVNVNANGTVTATGPQIAVAPAGNSVTTVGAPWTTGSVRVSAPTAGELYYLKGGDNRVNGVGSISMVAGGVSFRTLSKANANRGWINMVVGSPLPTVPSVSNTGLVLLAILFAAATTWMVRRSFARAS